MNSQSESGNVEKGLFDLLFAQRRLIYLLVTLLSLAGVWSARSLASAIYPELTFPRITIVAQGSSLGARQIIFSVSRPIEEAVSIVPGVVRVKSRSIRGASEVNVIFAEHTDMNEALQLVRTRVEQVRADLPAGMQIEIERQTPSVMPILNYNLVGGDAATLYDIARYQIKPVLSRIAGVGRVEVQGSDVREIEVLADPGRLAAAGLTYDGLASVISASTSVNAVGRVSRDYKQYLVVTAQEARSPEDIANISIRGTLRVKDVAEVVTGVEDHVRLVAGDGRPAALISVTRQIGGNTVAVSDSVAAALHSIEGALPPGVRLQAVYDQAALVRDAVKSVRDAMLIGAALAVLILLLFLGHLRITAISAATIPLTLAASVFAMKMLGQTFNLMTLGAMAIAIGLVIDDAVVVTENVVRHMHLTENRAQAVREALQEILWPVITSTLTTVVVFLPLRLLEGVAGQFFGALSLTLTICVLISLLLAVTIIPLLANQLVTARDSDTESQPRGGILYRIGAILNKLSGAYATALERCLRRPWLPVAAAPLLMALGVFIYFRVGTGFLPEMDEGAFILDYWTPGGTALSETDRQLHIVERILKETPEVESFSRRTGAEMGLFATEQNRGDISVRLKMRGERSRSIEEIISDVRARVLSATPRLRIEFVQLLSDMLDDLSGSSRPLEVKLFGSDMGALEKYANTVGPEIEKVAGLEDYFGGVAEPAAELEMRVRESAASLVGLTPAAVGSAASGALLGTSGGEIRLDDRTIAVRVRAPDAIRYDIRRLGALPIPVVGSKSGTPLAALADFQPTDVRSEYIRENQQQLIAITGGVEGRPLSGVMDDVRKILKSTPAPKGIRVEIGGRYASQQQAFQSLLLVLVLASVSVLAVMLIQFKSFVEPLVVLLAAPVSFVGAMGLLWFTGTALNVSSFMGLILLVGLIVKNGIILLDFTRLRMREANVGLAQALCDAGKVRLRPILMTTLCTLFGLMPLALGLGAGSELQKPLALSVIGGLGFSTLVTLFVVPSLLVAIRGRDWRLTE